MKLKIKVTKDVIKRAMWCGSNDNDYINENCAIALAIRDLFPDFKVTQTQITETEIIDGVYKSVGNTVCRLPIHATYFIKLFDSMTTDPEKRIEIEPIEFEVDIPEKYFPEIPEVHKILANCQTMELV